MRVVSTLRRRTTIRDPEEFRKRMTLAMERIGPILRRCEGFGGVSMDFGEVGVMSEQTLWNTAESWRKYMRGGAAAMVATISDALLPTAPYPHGIWIRETYEESHVIGVSRRRVL